MHTIGIDARAAELFAQGITEDVVLKAHGRLLPAIAIHAPEDSVYGWFVPIVVGKKLAAFMQFNKAGQFERFSSFMRVPGDLTSCPDRAGWVDPATIKGVAASRLSPGQYLGEPFLTFDRHPDRLVWAVPIRDDSGPLAYIYVAGDYVYTAA